VRAVKLRSAYHIFLTLFAVLFVGLQTTAISHAAQYEDVPHSHDGMVCDVEAIADDVEVLQPTLIAYGPTEYFAPAIFNQAVIETVYVRPPGRAPPPRSPPTLSA